MDDHTSIFFILHVHDILQRLFLSTTHTKTSYHQPLRLSPHNQHDSRRMFQLCAPIARGVSKRIRRSDPQHALALRLLEQLHTGPLSNGRLASVF